MDKRDWVPGKALYANTELDPWQDDIDEAIRRVVTIDDLVGIKAGLAVSETTPESMNVEVAQGVAWDKDGERCYIASTQTVDCTEDELGAAIAIPGAGNIKWVSLFLHFTRAQSDPRIDKNGNEVFFMQAESFTIRVVQGSEAPAPARPTLHASDILLCDIKFYNGMTEIDDADIWTDRREAFYMTTDTPVVEYGTVLEVLEYLDSIKFHNDGSRYFAGNLDPDGVTRNLGDSTPWNEGSLNVLHLIKDASALAPDDDMIDDAWSTDYPNSRVRSWGARTVEIKDRYHQRLPLELFEFDDDFIIGASVIAWWDEIKIGCVTTDYNGTDPFGSMRVEYNADAQQYRLASIWSVDIRNKPAFIVDVKFSIGGCVDWERYIGMMSDPDLTGVGFGFYIKTGNVFARCHDAGTFTDVDCGAIPDTTNYHRYEGRAIVDSAGAVVKCLFYIDGVLKATITTHLPVTGTLLTLRYSTITVAAPGATRYAYLDRMSARACRWSTT